MLAWLRQPISAAGISALFGTMSALVTQQVTWAQAMPPIGRVGIDRVARQCRRQGMRGVTGARDSNGYPTRKEQ